MPSPFISINSHILVGSHINLPITKGLGKLTSVAEAQEGVKKESSLEDEKVMSFWAQMKLNHPKHIFG